MSLIITFQAKKPISLVTSETVQASVKAAWYRRLACLPVGDELITVRAPAVPGRRQQHRLLSFLLTCHERRVPVSLSHRGKKRWSGTFRRVWLHWTPGSVIGHVYKGTSFAAVFAGSNMQINMLIQKLCIVPERHLHQKMLIQLQRLSSNCNSNFTFFT